MLSFSNRGAEGDDCLEEVASLTNFFCVMNHFCKLVGYVLARAMLR